MHSGEHSQCEAMASWGLSTTTKKPFAERLSPTLKPLAKVMSLSRPCTISFLALAEETEAAFSCCYLSTPRALHLGGCQAEAINSPGWREPPLCGNFAGTLQLPHLFLPNSWACNCLHLNPFPSRWVRSRKEENGLCQKKESLCLR